MRRVDIGANLGHESFRGDLDEVLARARRAGVEGIVGTGAAVTESAAAQRLAARHPKRLRSTAGVHPHLAREWGDASAGALRALLARTEVVAVGEAGLDFNRDFSPRPSQERAFEAQIELAIELGMPLFMHERDASERFVALLARHRHRLGPGVVHCFTGDERALDAYLDLDLHIGITGWICDERRGTHLHRLVRKIPSERLMVETDAPYLLPRDLRPRPRGRRNEPAYLPHIVARIAQHRGETPEQLAESSARTAIAFFGLGA